MKWLRRSLKALLALGAVTMAAVAAAWWLLGTQPGAAWLLARLEARAGGALELGAVDGSLLGGLELRDVKVRLQRDDLDIARLDLTMNAAAALRGHLVFDTARASPVGYRRHPAGGADGASSAMPALPFTIRVLDGVLESLTLKTEDDTLVFGATRFRARLAGGRLALEQVTTESGGVVLDGSGDIDLARVHVAADFDWSASIAGEPANGHFRVAGDWPVLELHHELRQPFRSVADGQLDVTDIPRVDLAIEWQDLVVPGISRFASPSGRATIAGAIDGYRFDAAGAVLVDGRAADVSAAGQGRGGQITLSSLTFSPRGTAGAGTLTAAGDVDLYAGEWSLAVAARDLDPAWWTADWPGRVTGSARLQGRLDPSVAAQADGIDVSGELRGYPLAATGAVAFDAPARWRFTRVHVESGPNSVNVDGGLGGATGEELGLDVSASLGKLSLLRPGVGGSLDAEVQLTGPWRAPRGRGTFEAHDVELGAYTFERISGSGEAGLAPDAPLALKIETGKVTRGPLGVDDVRATLTGTTARHRIAVTSDAAQWSASLAAGGGLSGATWQGTLDDAELDERALGAWRLVEPARLEVGAAGLALGTSCLEHAGGARWCAEMRVAGQPDDRLAVTAQNFELKSLGPLLPPELDLEGVYQLAASLTDPTGHPHGALAVTGGDTRAALAFAGQQSFVTELKDLRASATLEDGRLRLEGSVRRDEGGQAEIDATIERLGAPDSPISGHINVLWPDLGWIVLLSPDLGRVVGTVNANLAIGGTLASPQVEGRADWKDGQVGVPAWGLVVEGITASATTADGNTLAYTASGRAGDGTLTLEGSTRLDPDLGWPTRLKLKGDGIRAVQLPDAEIVASPDLEVVAALPRLHVSGTVQVTHADVKLSELPAQAVTPSADAVVHGERANRVVRPLHLDGDILLALGDDVHYSGLNLKTKVTGQLRLDVDSNRSANATGTLKLDGTYNAYGQELKLERGRLIFSGPLDDPGLDVRAVRTIEDVRVGVDLAGTIQNPRTRVFSTPSMSEADALSYLLLGRPVSSAGGQETATLQSAAVSMGLQQALPVVRRIGQSLGLDEFTVQTTATDTGALMAGKYLSPKVYIRYSYGLFNKIGGLLLRFKVNERLSIETRSGEQKSMDLIYTVEKD